MYVRMYRHIYSIHTDYIYIFICIFRIDSMLILFLTKYNDTIKFVNLTLLNSITFVEINHIFFNYVINNAPTPLY